MTGKKGPELIVEKSARGEVGTDLTPYLDGREYDRDVMISEARHYCQMALTGMFEAGKRLICLKQMEGYGGFLEAMKKTGIPQQRANELMSIAYFVTNHLVRQLPDSGNLKRLETMGTTRLLLLSRIPSDVLEQFGGEGDILGMEIDEIEAIPIEELRNLVRDLKKGNENGKKQNRRLQGKVDELEKAGVVDMTSLDGVREWTQKIFDYLMMIVILLGDDKAPDGEVFRGENGEACHALLKKVDLLMGRAQHKWEHELKGLWGLD